MREQILNAAVTNFGFEDNGTIILSTMYERGDTYEEMYVFYHDYRAQLINS